MGSETGWEESRDVSEVAGFMPKFMYMKKLLVLTLLAVMGLAFTTVLRFARVEEPVSVPASPQRRGDVAAGYRHLTTGDYLESGHPYTYFLIAVRKTRTTYLHM